MCGLALVLNSGGQFLGADKFMKSSFITNQVRGLDAAGVFQLQRTRADEAPTVAWKKDAVPGQQFIEDLEVEAMLHMADMRLATVGHVRHATQGSKKADNAHPFEIVRKNGTKLIGVHNGTLDGWRTKKDSDDHEVDSEFLFKMIAEDGVDAFEAITGAYALVWYDTAQPDYIWICRNDARELFFAYSEDKKAIVACSELGMLGWLADRHNMKLHKDRGQSPFWYFTPNVLYRISLEDMSLKTYEIPKYDPTCRRYDKPFVSTTTRYNASSREPWVDDGIDEYDWRYWNSSLKQQGSGYYASCAGTRQATILEGIKSALREARNATVPSDEDEAAIDQDLEAGLQAAIDKFAGTKETVFISNPNTRRAGKAEIARAKSVGVFGLAVKFSPVMFDEETNDLWGEIEYVDQGQVDRADALVRGYDSKLADAIIRGDKPVDMAVIGLKDPTNLKDGTMDYMIVTPDIENRALVPISRESNGTLH